MEITKQLASFFVNTQYHDLNDELIRLCKRHFLDWLAAAFVGYSDLGGKIVTEFVKDIGGNAEARLIGSGIKTSSINAALVNGTLGHILDFDDTAPAHPSSCIIPVLLALGEKLKLTGEKLILAQVLGYECFKRVFESAAANDSGLRTKGIHTSTLWGPISAGVTAAKLLNLNPQETAMTMGLAASQGVGLMQNFGTMTKGFHCGNNARAGVLSALLVQKGYTASQTILEGNYGFCNALIGKGNYDLNILTKDLGKDWRIISHGINMKRYPSCGSTNRAIETTIKIVKEHNLMFDQLDSIEVHLNSTIRSLLRFDEPTSDHEAKFSMQYAVAAAFVDRSVTLDTYRNEKVCSEIMKRTVKKVRLIVWDDNLNQEIKNTTPVKIILKNGIEYNEGTTVSFTTPEPLNDEELKNKFRYCAEIAGLSENKIEDCMNMVFDLENLNDLSKLLNSLIIN